MRCRDTAFNYEFLFINIPKIIGIKYNNEDEPLKKNLLELPKHIFG